MKKLTKNNVEEYVVDAGHEIIGGNLTKRFVRVDSNIIAKYFEERTKSGSSYVSYADDLIEECYDSNNRDENGRIVYPLKYFSVLLKDTYDHYSSYDGATHEILSSKFANMFGIPTVYNMKVKEDEKELVASLDFVHSGEKIITLDKLIRDYFDWETFINIQDSYDEFTSIEKWCKLIKKSLQYRLSRTIEDVDRRDAIINKCCEDFCFQFLFKTLIVNDQDITVYNFAFLEKDNGEIVLAPSHDYEYTLAGGFAAIAFFRLCCDMLPYMQKNFPERFQEFMSRFQKVAFNRSGDFREKDFLKVIRSEEKRDPIRNRYLKDMKQNIVRLQFAHSYISNCQDSTPVDTDIHRLYIEKQIEKHMDN